MRRWYSAEIFLIDCRNKIFLSDQKQAVIALFRIYLLINRFKRQKLFSVIFQMWR